MISGPSTPRCARDAQMRAGRWGCPLFTQALAPTSWRMETTVSLCCAAAGYVSVVAAAAASAFVATAAVSATCSSLLLFELGRFGSAFTTIR